MGIKNLNGFLREQCRWVFKDVPLFTLKGKRIAIDAHNWMYTNISVSHRKTVEITDVAVEEPNRDHTIKLWLNALVEFVNVWLSHDITPVFVFDGEAPVEKSDTKKERQEKKRKLRDEIDNAKKQVREKSILERTPQMVDKLRSLMKQNTWLSEDEQTKFKDLLSGIGIPMLKAKGDGEQLCCMLCIEGKVSAVFSADTDNLVYGCPMVITSFSDPIYDTENGVVFKQVATIQLRDVLKGLNLSFPMFVDLCIMMGCDYNTNIKNVGPKRSYSIINSVKSIDKIDGYDTSCLQHVRCREMFSVISSKTICSDEVIVDVNMKTFTERGREILQTYYLEHCYNKLFYNMRMMSSDSRNDNYRPPHVLKLNLKIKPLPE